MASHFPSSTPDNDSWNQSKFNVDLESANQSLLQAPRDSGAPWNPARTIKAPRKRLFSLGSWLWPRLCHRPKHLHKTAYLDGMRGFAALLVYWHHHELWVHNRDRLDQNTIFENNFGYDNKFHFAALPGVRIFFSGGHFAVSIFFVLSGYVLSIKPLKLIESDSQTELVDHLASSVFRRWLRLFLPVLVILIVYATSWHLLKIWVDEVTPQGNWFDEMWSLYCEFKNFSFLYKEGGVPWMSYSMHVWSIPVEFKGSLVVFGSLLAFSRCTLNARLWCQLALIGYFIWVADGWYCAMFVAGMLLSHLDLLATMGRLPNFLVQLRRYKIFIYYHLLVMSIYLGGVPCENREVHQLARNHGWYFLSFLKPQAVFDYKWFYLFWAAAMLVASVSHTSWPKRFFETPPCQYLGRISFALYLIHGPILWTLGDRLYAAVGLKGKAQMEHIPQWVDKFALSRAGPAGLEFCFLMAQSILLPITVFVADFVTRAVDKPSVKFAAWIYRATLSNTPTKHNKA